MRGCGNDPRTRLTPGDRAAVEEVQAFLAARARERAVVGPDGHRWVNVGENAKECADCQVRATQHRSREYGRWTDYVTAGGWSWHAPDGSSGPPPCPPPPVEALCPWEWNSMRYAGAKGEEQLATAMRTWCERHQSAVSECPEPGPYCPGALAHEDGEPGFPGPCTGRENSCRCRCAECCGDTPDMYGYDGPN